MLWLLKYILFICYCKLFFEKSKISCNFCVSHQILTQILTFATFCCRIEKVQLFCKSSNTYTNTYTYAIFLSTHKILYNNVIVNGNTIDKQECNYHMEPKILTFCNFLLQ